MSFCLLIQSYLSILQDLYLSMILGIRPNISWEEVKLQPLSDEQWLCSHLASSDRDDEDEVLHHCDLIRLMLEDEDLPALRPLDHELILMGLAHEAWRIGQDRFLFRRLTDQKDACISTFAMACSSNAQPASQSSFNAPLATSHLTLSFSSKRKLPSLQREWSRTLTALDRWVSSFKAMKSSPVVKLDRHRVFSSQVLYHLVMLHLYADLGFLNDLAYQASSLSSEQLKRLDEWYSCEDATAAIQHAISVHELLNGELTLPPKKRARHNILPFSESSPFRSDDMV